MEYPHLHVRTVKLSCLEGCGTGFRTESCLKWVGPIATVSCLQQGNIYTKRKLRVCREQKCIPLVGAKTIVTCADCQTTPCQGKRYGVKTGKLSTMGGGHIAMVACLHQGNIFTKIKLCVLRDQKCIPLVCRITPLTCAGCQTTPSRGR